MKRAGGLYPQICSFDALFKAYKKAKSGTRKTEEACRFFYRLEPELLLLQQELQQQNYQPGPYRYFEVNDPKRRTIAVAPFRDRVVHHAVVAALEPIFERCFIVDSYATRKGKGTHAAVFQAQRCLRQTGWYLKADIHKYFDSVNQETLLDLIARKVKDPDLLRLIGLIIRNGGRDGLGLPIGNLTSQFFANVYLNHFDYFVKETLRVRRYVRYMDDFVLFSTGKEALKAWLPAVEDFLGSELRLRLKPEELRLHPAAHGLPFLGVRIFPQLIRFLPEHSRRIRQKISDKTAAWEAGRLPEARFVDSMNSYHAHLSVFHTDALRRQAFGL